jgi:hypothetical protein
MRPGEKLHLFLAPGGCNATVIRDIIIPDYLPPAFTALERIDSSIISRDMSILQNRDVRFNTAHLDDIVCIMSVDHSSPSSSSEVSQVTECLQMFFNLLAKTDEPSSLEWVVVANAGVLTGRAELDQAIDLGEVNVANMTQRCQLAMPTDPQVCSYLKSIMTPTSDFVPCPLQTSLCQADKVRK